MQEILRKILRKILLALVRTLLRNGMAYGEFDQFAKRILAFVFQVTWITVLAQKAGIINPASQNPDNTIILLVACITLIDVKLREFLDFLAIEPGQDRNIGNGLLLTAWGKIAIGNIDKTLARNLVKLYSGDMPVAAMQKVLLNSANIKFTDDNKVRLLSHAYLPSDDPVEKLAILGTDAGQLVDTIDFNLTATEETLRFQRKASNPKVADGSIPEIKQFLRRKGQAFLEEIDLYLSQHETDDDTGKEVSVSVFYHESDDEDQEVEK